MPEWFANMHMGSNIKSQGDLVAKPVSGWLRLSTAMPARSCPLRACPLLHRWLIRADSRTYGHSGLLDFLKNYINVSIVYYVSYFANYDFDLAMAKDFNPN